jgi:large repetitive protein
MEEFKFNFSVKGKVMAGETINFTVSVKAGAAPLTIKDAAGNVLKDGDTVPLPAETVGVADPGSVLLNVSGGTSPYNFAVSSGAVPAGMTLNSTIGADGSETVTLSGTPTVAGDDAFALNVTDSAVPPAAVTTTVKKIN